jgi:hypothetical protein
LGLVGLSYVAMLFVFPTSIESISWPVLDKRWIIASFGLGIALIYAPLGFKRSADILKGQDPRGVWEHDQDTKALRRVWGVLAIAIGFALAALDIGQFVTIALGLPIDEAHEGAHLGGLQAISQGAIPYVEAHTQYGPGQQLITYYFMQNTEFTLRGFRASFFVMNILAEGLRFAIMLIAFGPIAGFAAILLSLVFYDPMIASFTGWAFLFRWSAPLLVGSLLPLIIWHDLRPWPRYASLTILSIAIGTLAWFAQENFISGLVTAGLVIFAGFARGRISLVEAITMLTVFAGIHVLTFISLISTITGLHNLWEAVRLCFYVGSLWAQGLANTAWSNPESPWTVAFYSTPIIVAAVTALALYAPRQTRLQDERKLAVVIGTSAAVVSLVPITLLRSDIHHFLGPAMPVPALIVAAVALLPGRLATNAFRREAVRLVLLVIFFSIYLAPQGISAIAWRLTPDPGRSWRGVVELVEIAARDKTTRDDTSLFYGRLGWHPSPEDKCFHFGSLTYGEIAARVQEISAKTAGRSVFIDFPGWTAPSIIYFFGDLRAGKSPQLDSTLWVRADLERFHADLFRHPPECIVTWNVSSSRVKIVLDVYGSYSTQSIRDGFVFCAQGGS